MTAAFSVAGLVLAISLYVSLYWLPRKMERAYQSALRTLATAVETKDSRTLGHAESIATLVVKVAEKLGLSRQEVRWARYAALLRDIGKAAVPYRILNEERPLTEGELRVVRNHVREGAVIVSQVPMLSPLCDIILHHHERWDGTGYPDRLAGESIPLISRIIGLADDYEAMTSDRPYHPAMEEAAAQLFIRRSAGTLYDPRVAAAFLEVVEAFPLRELSQQAVAVA